jgi:O-antigen/teichoic acid export membrane protein
MTTTPLRQAAFPQLSRVQDNPAQVSKSMLSCIRLTAILTVPALAGLAVTSHPLMAVMGSKWAPAANVLSVLCVVGIVLGFTRFTEALLPALSRPHHLAILKWVECVVSVGALVLIAVFLKGSPVTAQVMGMALARFAVGVVLFGPIFLFLVVRLSRITMSDFASAVGPSLLAASAMTAAILGISRTEVLARLRPVTALSVEVVFGAAIALGALWMLDHNLREQVWMLVSRAFARDEKTSIDALSSTSRPNRGKASVAILDRES